MEPGGEGVPYRQIMSISAAVSTRPMPVGDAGEMGSRRIPDGETGDRASWISFQVRRFRQLPWLVQRDRGVPRGGGL